MPTDELDDSRVLASLSRILLDGAPFTAIPGIDPATYLPPAPTVDAIRAPLEALTTTGRLGAAALSATIAGAVPGAAASAMSNPESALNSATVGVIGATVGSIASIPGFNDARGNPSKARVGAGPNLWVVNPGEGTPTLAIANDVVFQATITSLPWTPTLLPNKVAWYDAQSLAISNGAAVASWTDLSGLGNHAVQAGGTAQPLMNTTKINGKKAVVADGVNDFLLATLGTAYADQAFTVYAVGGTDLADNVSGSDFLFGGGDTTTGVTRLDLFRTTTEAYSMSRGTSFSSAASAWTVGTKTIKAVFNGASSALTVDGVSVGTGTTSLSGVTVGKLSLFARTDGANFMPGYLGEVIVVQGTVSSDNDTKVLAYLASRWA